MIGGGFAGHERAPPPRAPHAPPPFTVRSDGASREPVRTRIKICGVRSEAIVQAAARSGADAVGFVRVPTSPRFIDAASARRLAALLPSTIAAVAVHANADPGEIAYEWPHGWIQLHGAELEIDERLAPRTIIKALSIAAGEAAILHWDRHPQVHAVLIDAPNPGAGETFDHGQLAALRAELTKPLILAGGLTPENVGRAIHALRPWAVDVSSGVERVRGEKDAALIDAFCAAVRAADAER